MTRTTDLRMWRRFTAPVSPYGNIGVNADSTMRGVTLAVPLPIVSQMLPRGLKAGPQLLTQGDTHPVLLMFSDMFRLQLSVLNLIPNMTYHEFHIGIPWVYLSTGPAAGSEPYYFMPRLCLDNVMAIFGGILFWGFAKEIASIDVTTEYYTVTSLTGQRVASLWRKQLLEEFRPVSDFPLFSLIEQALSLPIVSRAPMSVGPYFLRSDMQRDWDVAVLCPLLTNLSINGEPLAGMRILPDRTTMRTEGIDKSPMGSYELRVPFRLSLPSFPGANIASPSLK